MNSADKRIEELLNRAWQTISDLPSVKHYADNSKGVAKVLLSMYEWDGYRSHTEAQRRLYYIRHLVDIIDRLETALENTCNERDYLAYRLNWLSMYRHRDCQSCERVYECKRTPDHCLGWVFGGVPEDWSVDDE